MIKTIMQYINDVRFQLSHSDMDDFIWIILPLATFLGGVAFTLSLIIQAIL